MKRKIIFAAIALVLLFNNVGFAQSEPDEIVWLKTRNELGLELIINAVFTPDDMSIIITDANHKVIEIDAITGAFKRDIPNLRGVFRFSDDGQYVYTYDSKKVHFLSGEEIGQFKMNGVPVSGFTESDINEKAGVLVGVFFHSQQHPTLWTRSIFVFDLNTFQLIDTIGINDNYYYSIALTGDGKYFRTLSEFNPDPTVETDDRYISMIWETGKRDTLFEKQGLGHMKPSPDGRWLASVAVNTVRVFDANTWEQRFEWKHNETNSGSLSAIDFSPDSRFLATCGALGGLSESSKKIIDIHIWDLEKGKLDYKYNNGTNMVASQESIYFSYNGNYLLGVASAGVMLYTRISTTVNDKQPNNNNLILYPNPTSGEITINFIGAESIKIIDMKGNIILEKSVNEPVLSIPNIFSPGTYICVVKSGDREYSQKFQVVR